MGLKRGAALFAAMLIALSLAGCKTDDSFESATSDNATDSASTGPWWKGRPMAVSSTRAADGISPSFTSAAPKVVNADNMASTSAAPKVVNADKMAPSNQPVPPVRDGSVAQTAASLTSVATPGSLGYRIGPLDVLDITVFQ